jgi:single-strand DNA-binding protein
MAGSVNKAIIIGNVGRDPEVRTFQSGGRIVSFSIATSESWRDKSTGERKERTEWHNISIMNDALGKIAEQYVRKGSKVYIEGQIQTRAWQDKDGNERKSTEIVIPMFGGVLALLDGKDGGGKPAAPSAREPSSDRTYNNQLSSQLDDDIPF